MQNIATFELCCKVSVSSYLVVLVLFLETIDSNAMTIDNSTENTEIVYFPISVYLFSANYR